MISSKNSRSVAADRCQGSWGTLYFWSRANFTGLALNFDACHPWFSGSMGSHRFGFGDSRLLGSKAKCISSGDSKVLKYSETFGVSPLIAFIVWSPSSEFWKLLLTMVFKLINSLIHETCARFWFSRSVSQNTESWKPTSFAVYDRVHSYSKTNRCQNLIQSFHHHQISDISGLFMVQPRFYIKISNLRFV